MILANGIDNNGPWEMWEWDVSNNELVGYNHIKTMLIVTFNVDTDLNGLFNNKNKWFWEYDGINWKSNVLLALINNDKTTE